MSCGSRGNEAVPRDAQSRSRDDPLRPSNACRCFFPFLGVSKRGGAFCTTADEGRRMNDWVFKVNLERTDLPPRDDVADGGGVRAASMRGAGERQRSVLAQTPTSATSETVPSESASRRGDASGVDFSRVSPSATRRPRAARAEARAWSRAEPRAWSHARLGSRARRPRRSGAALCGRSMAARVRPSRARRSLGSPLANLVRGSF